MLCTNRTRTCDHNIIRTFHFSVSKYTLYIIIYTHTLKLLRLFEWICVLQVGSFIFGFLKLNSAIRSLKLVAFFSDLALSQITSRFTALQMVLHFNYKKITIINCDISNCAIYFTLYTTVTCLMNNNINTI